MQEMPSHDAQFDGHCDHIVAEAQRMTTETLNGSKQTKGDLRPRRKEAKDQENGISSAEPRAEVPGQQQYRASLDPDCALADVSGSEFDLYE